MTAVELLTHLRELGIHVTANGDRLCLNAPRGALTNELREAIAQHKPELLDLLRVRPKSRAATAIEPVSREGPMPLSFAQQRLWFLEQLTPGDSTYNVSIARRLSGALDVAALRGALNEIVARHEVLRTIFPADDGEPRQVVLDALEVSLGVEGLDGDPGQREQAVRGRAVKEARRPFDLARGPVIRARLLRFGEEEHVLLLSLHHIVMDVWSISVLFRELAALYRAFKEGQTSPLPPLPIQYTDYAVWERHYLEGGTLADLVAWWKRHLTGITAMDLPTDRQRPTVQSFAGDHHRAMLPGAIRDGLKRLAREEQASVFMVMLAAFETLLHRYTGQDDIVVGTPVVSRGRQELEGLIGLFANTLVLRGDLSSNPSFRQLLRQVREETLGAYEHQSLPFDILVDALQSTRDLSRNPIFQVFFAQLNVDPTGARGAVSDPLALDLPGVRVSPIESLARRTHFDLELDVTDTPEGLVTNFVYSTALFDAGTIERMACHYRTLLEGIVADPDRRLFELPLMGEAERARTLVDRNAMGCAYPRERRLHELFEARAAERPQQVAVSFGEDALSYGELSHRARQLAHYLRSLGVGPGERVGIYVERGLAMVVGLLGVLEAGGAYVPLDPSYPSERVGFMLGDARARVLLTTSDLVEALPGHEAEVVCLDTDWGRIAARSAEAVGGGASPDDLAYVIYTSGSTGRPKGVEIPHRAVVNFLSAMAEEPGLRADDVLVAVTTLSFDIAGLELFLPLSVGARVVLASREESIDGAALGRRLGEVGATVMQATPTTWRLLLHSGWSGDGRLKALCGGEAWGWDLAEALLDRCGSVWNMYGPTETTIWSAVRELRPGDGQVLIGGPIANTTLYVLDAHRQPVPIGVPGELYIGGDGLGRGYWGRPELTEQAFVPDPFHGEDAGARLYRTGDRVRALPDGGMAFLDRIDHQVKLRGYRIELGEIETVLATHPAVSAGVAVVREDTPGDQRLVAYVVGRDGVEPTSSELRELLRERLPEYMIPAAFVPLEALPLTPNNKIDRKALLAAPMNNMESGAAYVAPRDALELQLTNIWRKVLRVGSMGVTDNFFDLGGHSLLGVQLFAEIKEVLGKHIPLATLFQAQTVEQLANMLRQSDWRPDWSSLVTIRPAGSKPPLFLIHGAEGNVLLYMDLARYLRSDQPVYGLQSMGLDGSDHLLTRLEDIATHYIKEIRSLQPEGPYYLAGYCLGGTIAYEMGRQLHAQNQEVALLGMFETYNLKAIASVSSSSLKYRFLIQNARFHLDNFLMIGPREKYKFILEKMKIAKRRLRVQIRIACAKLSNMFRLSHQRAYPHLYITKINDRAQYDYVPKAYPACVTLFRPEKHFSGLDDFQFGWGGLAEGGVDVHMLSVNPRGMLVEPFVKVLADELTACIDSVAEVAESTLETRR